MDYIYMRNLNRESFSNSPDPGLFFPAMETHLIPCPDFATRE